MPEGIQYQRVFLGPNLTLCGEFLDLGKKRFNGDGVEITVIFPNQKDTFGDLAFFFLD